MRPIYTSAEVQMISQRAQLSTQYADPFKAKSAFFFTGRQEWSCLDGKACSTFLLKDSLSQYCFQKEPRIGKPNSAVRRFVNAKFSNELNVSEKSIVKYDFGNDESIFPAISFQIKIAELDFHLFNLGDDSIGRYERAICPGRQRKKERGDQSPDRQETTDPSHGCASYARTSALCAPRCGTAR